MSADPGAYFPGCRLQADPVYYLNIWPDPDRSLPFSNPQGGVPRPASPYDHQVGETINGGHCDDKGVVCKVLVNGSIGGNPMFESTPESSTSMPHYFGG